MLMLIRTPADLGAIIRERRKAMKLGQADLAKLIGTSRQWIIGVEQGRARVELGLVLRALDALGVRLASEITKASPKHAPDLDAIVASARKGRK
jgi:HTH-type transcriptional regulator / antitoxin HipB